MYICVYMCICVYVYICVYIYIYICINISYVQILDLWPCEYRIGTLFRGTKTSSMMYLPTLVFQCLWLNILTSMFFQHLSPFLSKPNLGKSEKSYIILLSWDDSLTLNSKPGPWVFPLQPTHSSFTKLRIRWHQGRARPKMARARRLARWFP